jgi:hypothetical protein
MEDTVAPLLDREPAQDRTTGPAPRPAAAPAPPGLLHLQRAAGNAAVAQLVAVQRCRPAQHDHKPKAPWATLQKGYQTRCGVAAGGLLDQAGQAIGDLLSGKAPKAPRIDERGSVDCACALGTPFEAALGAMPVVAAAGGLAAEFYWHFLGGSGSAMPIDVADMLARSAGVRAAVRRSIGRGGMAGDTRLEQSTYGDRELQFAYGAIDCVHWKVAAPAGRSWRRDPTTPVEISMVDYYEFHPERPGVSQCAHAACVELVARGEAANFWMTGTATVPWGDLKR